MWKRTKRDSCRVHLINAAYEYLIMDTPELVASRKTDAGDGIDRCRQESQPDELMTAEEAAQALKVSPATVYRMVRTGELGGVRFGRTVRIRWVELVRFIQDHSG